MAYKHKGLEMYFNQEIASAFAKHEQNEKNFRVADITDLIIMSDLELIKLPIYVVDLGGGAHPDRYHRLFNYLIRYNGHIDWVDISPHMLKLAKHYINTKKYNNRKKVISFVNEDILNYLRKLPNNKFNVAIMKYTLDHIKNLDSLFSLFSSKLKSNGRVVATITTLEPKLKSISTNARFFYKGEEFPIKEYRYLKDDESFIIKFFKESGNPSSGYIKGAETTKYYHSATKMKKLAKKYNFKIFLGDWKKLLPKEKQKNETMDQDFLILTK